MAPPWLRELPGRAASLAWTLVTLPVTRPGAAWFYVFFPALVLYLQSLHAHLNALPEAGTIVALDESFYQLVPAGTKLEALTSGLDWAEGVLYREHATTPHVLFSDTINNVVLKLPTVSRGGFLPAGRSVYLPSSGCSRGSPRCEQVMEPGSNGLAQLPTGELVVCQHGDRSVTAVMENGTRRVLASTVGGGKKLNSPNDAVIGCGGEVIFTDPPYGMYAAGGGDPGGDDSQRLELGREVDHNGVYVLPAAAVEAVLRGGGGEEPVLLHAGMERPNGVGLSPDGRTLYVANSHPPRPVWLAFDLPAGAAGRWSEAGELARARVFFDSAGMEEEGNPDGLAVDARGNVWASGPGGVLVITPEGKHIGTLKTPGRVVGNIALGGDGFVYLSACDAILRMRVLVGPAPVAPCPAADAGEANDGDAGDDGAGAGAGPDAAGQQGAGVQETAEAEVLAQPAEAEDAA
mmetsp:Transcript_1289/g.4398  ORF Transcript_1289/g.4398 Transcript_1289/m.4398 type:complete len:462 (+) Transcript_1289:134-1519(+)